MYHQGIRNVRPPRPSNVKYQGRSIENQLTLHHLIPVNRYKARGIKGATTIENCSVLCRRLSYIHRIITRRRKRKNKRRIKAI